MFEWTLIRNGVCAVTVMALAACSTDQYVEPIKNLSTVLDGNYQIINRIQEEDLRRYNEKLLKDALSRPRALTAVKDTCTNTAKSCELQLLDADLANPVAIPATALPADVTKVQQQTIVLQELLGEIRSYLGGLQAIAEAGTAEEINKANASIFENFGKIGSVGAKLGDIDVDLFNEAYKKISDPIAKSLDLAVELYFDRQKTDILRVHVARAQALFVVAAPSANLAMTLALENEVGQGETAFARYKGTLPDSSLGDIETLIANAARYNAALKAVAPIDKGQLLAPFFEAHTKLDNQLQGRDLTFKQLKAQFKELVETGKKLKAIADAL